MDLLHPYLGKGHRLFVDNFYTSIPLFLELLQHKMFATGTIISNHRHFPEGLKAVNLHEVGSYRFAVCDKMMACVWHDRRNVTMLSTMHNTSVTTILKRSKGKRDKQPLPFPS